jgi:hypothetical protein
MGQSQGMIQGTINTGSYDGHLRPHSGQACLRMAVLNFHRMLFNLQRIHPATKLQLHPGVYGALRQSTIEFTFINDLCERRFRPMLQLPSPWRDGLNTSDV